MVIEEISHIDEVIEPLCDVLIDGVGSGASIGYTAPLEREQAYRYWQSIQAEISAGYKKLIVARKNAEILGCVQLSFCMKDNGLHRAEVEKLIVHRSMRGRGIGKQLMSFLENCAEKNDRSLLVLDTKVGDTASFLYRKLGYIEVGEIPYFAKDSNGAFEPTVYFYKKLEYIK
ncbi:GNAT family N-acetyltransferase [Aliikangiella coralliicola]|uniref:GNAT family N-acetyltransferase n=1 Tax=Aliikangiella coralliicola TaxID=2592383 RepID=A0A545U7I6_9GAMM|nr:GNAT family N-acetyltransferase [Aliikangiella coralliicola]TQV85429.1 GNAT family N-acetyltransferase [Aliikangiella coralliicola]